MFSHAKGSRHDDLPDRTGRRTWAECQPLQSHGVPLFTQSLQGEQDYKLKYPPLATSENMLAGHDKPPGFHKAPVTLTTLLVFLLEPVSHPLEEYEVSGGRADDPKISNVAKVHPGSKSSLPSWGYQSKDWFPSANSQPAHQSHCTGTLISAQVITSHLGHILVAACSQQLCCAKNVKKGSKVCTKSQ